MKSQPTGWLCCYPANRPVFEITLFLTIQNSIRTMENNTTLVVVLVILVGHFLFGIGYLLYKIAGPSSKKNEKREE